MYDTFKKLCEEKKISPSDVSKATGIATATLTSWKKGDYTPKADKLQKIADYLDVSMEYLMTGEDNPSAGQRYDITPFEFKIVVAYRAADDYDRTSVLRTLHIEDVAVKKEDFA